MLFALSPEVSNVQYVESPRCNTEAMWALQHVDLLSGVPTVEIQSKWSGRVGNLAMVRKSRTDVVAAARTLFARQGFHGTSMRDLGREVGLKGSSLYNHVGSKDELLVDVVREAALSFQALADEVVAMSAPAPQRLSRLVHGHLEILIRDRDQAKTFLNEIRFLPEPERDAAVTIFDRYQEVFREVLESGCERREFRPDLDVSLAANLVLSLLNGTHRWYSPERGLSIGSLGDEIYQLLYSGLSLSPGGDGL